VAIPAAWGGAAPFLVIDGTPPASMHAALIRDLDVFPRRYQERPLCLVRSETAGRAVLARHNAANDVVTVIGRNGFVARLDKTTGKQVPLRGTTTVAGRVRDGNGRPLAGVLVNLTSPFGGDARFERFVPKAAEIRDIRTGDDGRYSIMGMPRGAWVLSVAEPRITAGGSQRRFRYAPSSLRLVTLREPFERIDIQLRETGVPCAECGRIHFTPAHTH